MEHGKYVNAIKVYQKALRQETEDEAAVTDTRKPETVAAEKAETVQEAETTEASTEIKTEEAAETESPVAITIDMVEDPEERAETENVEESEKPEEDTSETDATSLQEKNRKKWQQIRNFLTRRSFSENSLSGKSITTWDVPMRDCFRWKKQSGALRSPMENCTRWVR